MIKTDLIKLIPDIFREVREFNEIFSSVESKARRIEDELKQQTSDMYIYSEDISEKGVDRLAQSLKVDVSGLAFEDKVFKIKTFLIDKRPYNIPNVKNMLNVLCGEDGYLFSVDNKTLSVSVKLDLGRKNQFAAVYELLDKVIPSNMLLATEILYNLHGDLTEMTHETLNTKTHQQIRSDVL